MKLSIVIPVYNVERFLRQCLDSIVNQYDSGCTEVVLVNDGSVDESLRICREYESQYKNIQVVSQDNRGASTARNEGLKIAKGEWIWFVDADDMVQQYCLSKISMLISKDSNIDVFCFNHSTLKREGIADCVVFTKNTTLTGLDYLKLHTSMYLWDKVFRRTAIGEVKFVDGIRNTEDMLFALQVMLKAKKVEISSDNVYIYNQTNSTSTLSDRRLSSLIRNSNDTYIVNERLLSLSNEERDNECRNELRKRLNFGVTAHLYSLFNDRLPSCYIKEMVRKYKSLNIYPVKKSYNKRGNMFNILANREWMFILVVDCMRMLMKGRFIGDVK